MAIGNFRRGLITMLGGLPRPSRPPLPANKAMAMQQQIKTVGSGVQWVGSPDFRSIIRLDSVSDPDAEELTRSIALATSAYCYTATMYRASKVSEPPLYLIQEDVEGGETVITDHEIIPLLDEPSLDFDMTELLARTEIYLLTTGAAAWVKVRDLAGRAVQLQPFSGDEVRTYSADGRIYGGFKILMSTGGWKDYAPEEVVYFKEINPSSWRVNLSKLDVALSQLDLGHQVNRTIRNFMRKAMFPGGVVSPHPDWDPEDDEWDEFKNMIDAWYGGPAAAGNPLVLQGGATFSRAAIPLKELLPTELLDRIEATVGSVYGVAPIVLGWKVGLENSPWSQMGEARISVYEETISPRWTEFRRKMGRQLLTPEERAAGYALRFDLTDIAALRADDKARADVAMQMRDEWTRNERRAYTGQEPLGDEDPRGDEIGTGAAAAGAEAFLTQLSSHSVSSGLSKAFAAAYGEKRLEGKALEWAVFDLNTKASETSWSRVVAKILDDQRRQVIALALEHLKPVKAEGSGIDPDSTLQFIEALAKWTREKGEKQLASGLYPLVVGTGTVAVKRAAAQVGLNFAVLEPGLLTYAKEEAEFLASVMGETTGRKVATIVQNRLDAGGLISDLRKDLEESAAFSRTRAQMVARTETTRAWNGAQRRTLSEYEQDSDETVKMYKEWLTAGDDRVREEHAEISGEKRRIDETFSNGLQEPGEPNCRCTLLYTMEQVEAIEPSSEEE